MTTETTVTVRREIVRAIELAQHHQQLASEADTDEAQKAHRSTMRAYDKAGAEFASGNYPRFVGYGLYFVSSRSTAGVVYRVSMANGSCNCEAGMSGRDCWHVKAAEIAEETRLALERAAEEAEEARLQAVLDHEQAPEPMAEAYAYESAPASDGDDEPEHDLYPRNMPRGFRGDIGI